MALLLPQPAGAESLKDQFIRRKCEAKVNEELVTRGIASPPPMFAQKVCDCVVQKVNSGSTIEAAAGESANPAPTTP